MTDKEGREKTIRSDERLFDIVESMAESEVVGVTELADEVDMAKSTVHGHLMALKNRGYVVKEDDGYRLGLEFLNYGKHVQTSYELYPLGKEKVDQLARETGERAWCMVEENGLAYYLVGAEGEHSIQPPSRIGKGVPLHNRSAGKAILAHLPASRVEEIIERHGLEVTTSNTVTDESELFEELEVIRERGYAINDAESLSGLYAVGAPILDDGAVRGALTISGPKKRVKTQETRDEFIGLLLGATNELEINLRNFRSNRR